jgi:regulatory protein
VLAKIHSCALDLLARREHSKFELKRKLSKKDFASSDIEKILKELAEKGLQSDNRFIESYINMRSRRGFGPLRIELELCERGIDKEAMEGFLSASDPVWFELAKTSRIKKFGKDLPANLHEKARRVRYLNYKGFTGDQINMSL